MISLYFLISTGITFGAGGKTISEDERVSWHHGMDVYYLVCDKLTAQVADEFKKSRSENVRYVLVRFAECYRFVAAC